MFYRKAVSILVAIALLAVAIAAGIDTISSNSDSPRNAAPSLPTIAGTQPSPSGAELRLAARANSDGSISIGVQRRENGSWRGSVPQLSRLPADAVNDVWYATSSIAVPTRRIEAEIRTKSPEWYREVDNRTLILSSGDREWRIDESLRLLVNLDSDAMSFETYNFESGESRPIATAIGREPTGEGTQLVRVLGRSAAGNAIELGLQRLAGRDWLPIEQPSRAVVTLAAAGVWVFTEPFAVPQLAPVFRGELRSGATIDTIDGSIQVTVDGQVKSSQCGFLGFDTSVTIQVFSKSDDCQSDETLFSICSADTTARQCDAQQFHVYWWEHRHTGPAQIELTEAEIARIVQAVYGDYVTGTRPPAARRSEDAGNSYWSSGDHTVYILPSHRRLKVVLHETAHAIIDGLGKRDPGHGANFAAMNLSVFSRYAPLVDTRAMRRDAERVGVQIANWLPIPVSDEGIEVVRQVICDRGESGQAMCDAFDAQATGVVAAEVEGRGSSGSGRIDDVTWHSALLESGGWWSSVTKEKQVDDAGGELARLRVTCNSDHAPQVEIWWPGEAPLSEEIEHQVGSLGWVAERWNARPAPWGDSRQQLLSTYVPHRLAAQLGWAASAGLTWAIRLTDGQGTYELSFDLDDFFRTPAQANLALCLFNGERSLEPFVGWGELPGGRYWAHIDDAGVLSSAVYVDAIPRSHPEKVARLEVTCSRHDRLNVLVWWRDLDGVNPLIEYGFDDSIGEQAHWHVGSGTWGEDVEWSSLRAPNSLQLVSRMAWRGAAGQKLWFSVHANGETFEVTFPLDHLFETPVQGNLSRCGEDVQQSDSEASVIDHGRFGDDFWWGVVEADDPLRTYVVKQTAIADDGSRLARLQIECARDALQVNVHWDVPSDLDRTVSVTVSGGSTATAEWRSGTSTWYDGVFRQITAPIEDAADLIRQLAWTAQADGSLTVESHERNNPNRRYTATFNLDGLFETTVQPNLARCGR